MNTLPIVKERPILFSGAMVRALLDGSKTQTRRIIKSPTGTFVVNKTMAGEVIGLETTNADGFTTKPLLCPYGQPGDRLWVRETLFWSTCDDDWCYQADNVQLWTARQDDAYTANILKQEKKGIPSIHMPREASRLLLEITEVRCERLQDISEADAVAEGVDMRKHAYYENGALVMIGEHNAGIERFCKVLGARAQYAFLWNEINGSGAWEANPFVWCVTFKIISPA